MSNILELRDFTQTGLQIFVASTNFRYQIMNLHRTDDSVSFVRKFPLPRDSSKEVVLLSVDKYPSLDDEHPFVLRKKSKFAERRIIHIPLPQTFLVSAAATVEKGDPITFTLTTENVPEGATIPYIITGIALNQTTGLSALTGNFTIDEDGEATLTFTVKSTAPTASFRLTLTETGEYDTVSVIPAVP